MYGSKVRIVQAHMSPEQLRLQVRYSEFFDFRNLTKDWMDIFVRWFLSEPLTASSPPHDSNSPEQPETSDDEGDAMVPTSPERQKHRSCEPRSPERGSAPQKPEARPLWSPRCNAGEVSLGHNMTRSSILVDAR